MTQESESEELRHAEPAIGFAYRNRHPTYLLEFTWRSRSSLLSAAFPNAWLRSSWAVDVPEKPNQNRPNAVMVTLRQECPPKRAA
jgi:hypothetical protein